MKFMHTVLALLVVVALGACSSSQSKTPDDRAGNAYDDVDAIHTLYVLPVKMPNEIHGNANDADKERWQTDWPMVAARLIARGVTDETGNKVSASVREKKPEADYYFELRITYLDIGDTAIRSAHTFSSGEEGWSHVLATGRIVRADNGETVAELTFDQSTGQKTKEPFQNDMNNLGQELGNWIMARR